MRNPSDRYQLLKKFNQLLSSPTFGERLLGCIKGLLWFISIGAIVAALVSLSHAHFFYTVACLGVALSFCPYDVAPIWWRVIVSFLCLVLLS